MASHETPRLSVWERVGLFMRIPIYAVNGLFQNLCLLPYVILGRLSFKRSLGTSFMRANVLTRRHRLFLAPTTGDATKTACKKNGLTITSEPVPSQTKDVPSATLHTIGVPGSDSSPLSPSTSDQTVILYLHGGGYLYALRADGLMPLIMRVAQTAHAKRVYLLEYTLAPELKYPGQLAQTAAALSLLIGQKGVKPENIVLFGDSAGAHLVLSLLAHLQQPHPKIPAVTEFSRNGSARQPQRPSFKGALLISPWVSMNTRTPSYARNSGVDMLDVPKVQFFVDNWEPRTDEVWGEMLAAPEGASQARANFWRDLPVRSIFSTIGDWEVFLDGAREMQAILLEAGVDSTLVEGKNEIHAQPVVDSALKEPDSECTMAMLKWLDKL